MIQTRDVRQLILQHPLFNLFAGDAQERLLSEAQQRHAPASSLLLQQGQPAERFFLVLSGRVKLFRISADGQEKVVEIIHPGQTFAEAVMFMQHAVYPVCAESLDAVELVRDGQLADDPADVWIGVQLLDDRERLHACRVRSQPPVEAAHADLGAEPLLARHVHL